MSTKTLTAGAGGGSPYGSDASTHHGSKMSCLLCGHHVAQREGIRRRIMGGIHFVCFACKPDPSRAAAAMAQA